MTSPVRPSAGFFIRGQASTCTGRLTNQAETVHANMAYPTCCWVGERPTVTPDASPPPEPTPDSGRTGAGVTRVYRPDSGSDKEVIGILRERESRGADYDGRSRRIVLR
jgi:hypothetical protein